MEIILAIFNYSGKTPISKDKLIMLIQKSF